MTTWWSEVNPRGRFWLVMVPALGILEGATGLFAAHPIACAIGLVAMAWESATIIARARERHRDRLADGRREELSPFLADAQREVDAMLPGTPPIAPRQMTEREIQQALGAMNAAPGQFTSEVLMHQPNEQGQIETHVLWRSPMASALNANQAQSNASAHVMFQQQAQLAQWHARQQAQSELNLLAQQGAPQHIQAQAIFAAVARCHCTSCDRPLEICEMYGHGQSARA